MVTWTRKMAKGNARGAGWLTLPAKLRDRARLGHWYNVTLASEQILIDSLSFSVKLTKMKESWGCYIPQNICLEHSLLGQMIKVTLKALDYIPCKIYEDKRVRIPNSVVEKNRMLPGDCYKVELKVGAESYSEVVIITSVDRANRNRVDESFFLFRLQDIPVKTNGQFKILKKIEVLNPEAQDAEINKDQLYIPELFPDAIIAKLGENRMQVFLGNHMPIITPIHLNILELVHYIGCYYADGTKVGPGWSISASTPDQALYYENTYKKLVKEQKLSYNLTYTKKPFDNRSLTELSDDLINYWKENANITLKTKSVKIIESESDETRNWNKFGSIRIRDHRSLVLKYHLKIMKLIIEHLKTNNNVEILWDMLFGIFEGDGYVSGGKDRFGLGISAHAEDTVIGDILKKLNISFRIDDYKVKSGKSAGIEFRFGLFEILTRLKKFHIKLFRYYPKRRKLFIERLLKQATVEHIMSIKQTESNFSLSFIEQNNLDSKEVLEILMNLSNQLNFM